MKTRLMIAAAAVMALQARQTMSMGENTVIVYFENALAPRDDFAAKGQVERMFASAGVQIVWRNGTPSADVIAGERSIVVRFVLHTPDTDHPGALAFALPYEGTHLRIFYDRVQLENPRATQAVLAHVLVHEITHLLQRIERHSECGIMKAHWTAEDYSEMTFRPLAFTPDDIALIHAGLNVRKTPGVVPTSAASTAPRETDPVSLRQGTR